MNTQNIDPFNEEDWDEEEKYDYQKGYYNNTLIIYHNKKEDNWRYEITGTITLKNEMIASGDIEEDRNSEHHQWILVGMRIEEVLIKEMGKYKR